MAAPARLLEVFLVALRLGLTSFGGPVAHIGFFRDEYVERRKWLGEQEYADLVALCQFLPGPASSQVGFGVGVKRAGVLGGFVAWLGFTLPSAIALTVFALGLAQMGDVSGAGWLKGLKIAAVAVVANAVWGMGVKLCPDRARASLAIAMAGLVLLTQQPWMQIVAIAIGAAIGAWRFDAPDTDEALDTQRIRKRTFAPLVLFVGLLVVLPLAANATENRALDYTDSFYRSGALVFGGGHVVLPLLEAEVVEPGWVDQDTFLAGYGAAQAVPGPLFTLSSFLGASMDEAPTGWAGSALCLVAIFLPAWLLVLGAMPLWAAVRRWRFARAATTGANAAVVGILLAALYHPVWTVAITGVMPFVIALVCFGLLRFWRVPSWAVVLAAAGAGQLLLA